LVVVFVEALAKGTTAYLAALADPDTRSALRLTLVVASVTVPLNLVFGVTASWAIAKFDFRGKNMLITLIDLPFAVSPVIAGLIYVLRVRRARLVWPMADRAQHPYYLCGSWHHPGHNLCHFSFVARELIPLMAGAGDRGGADCDLTRRKVAGRPFGT